MRIAYLTEWTPYAETGVLRKLIAQVRTWRELGAEAELFSLAPLQDAAPALDFAVHGRVVGVFRQDQLDRHPRARLGYVNKIATVPKLRRVLADYRPDVVFYRQNGPWYPGLGSLLGIAPTVIEINTDERAEHALWGAGFNTLYRATQRRILERASGFISVTGELAKSYRELGKPIAVVGNGFWGEPPATVPPSGSTEPVFTFVGSRLTSAASWHGADKIFPLAVAMPASTFNIVGLDATDFPGLAPPANVVLHGHKSTAELVAILEKSDIGIGTLALHRKSMEEACPLKVREYLMYRLPVVAGYREVEERLRHADYFLEIGNYENNVVDHIDAIAGFARRWHGRRIDADLSFLGMKAKAAEYLRFFEDVRRGTAAAPATGGAV